LPANATAGTPAGIGNIEGLPVSADSEYGGGATPNDNDNSGVLKYVRIEFGGYAYQIDKEINGLTMGSVGRSTVIDYVQTSYTNDDSFECSAVPSTRSTSLLTVVWTTIWTATSVSAGKSSSP
jgi:hypothetical protein